MAKVALHANKARFTISIVDNWNLGSGLTVRAYLPGRLIISSFFP